MKNICTNQEKVTGYIAISIYNTIMHLSRAHKEKIVLFSLRALHFRWRFLAITGSTLCFLEFCTDFVLNRSSFSANSYMKVIGSTPKASEMPRPYPCRGYPRIRLYVRLTHDILLARVRLFPFFTATRFVRLIARSSMERVTPHARVVVRCGRSVRL